MNSVKSSPEDLKRLESLSGGQYNSEKNIFIYTSSAQGRAPQIRLINLDTDSEEILIEGGTNSRLDASGNNICYMRNGQIWVYDIAKKKDTQITTMRFGAFDPIWSPDGSKICFMSQCSSVADVQWLQETPEGNNQKEDTSRPIVIDDFGYKFDGLGFHSPERIHLWVVNKSGGMAWRITDGEHDHLHHNWSPDSEKIVFISSRDREKKESLANDLFLVDYKGEKITKIKCKGWLASYPSPFRPIFTPDGKYIIVAMFDQGDMSGMTDLPFAHMHKVAADGTEDTSIFPDDAPCYECVQFPYNTGAPRSYDNAQISSDGKYCYFCAGVNGAGNIYKANIYGQPKIEKITDEKWVVSGIDKPQENKVVISLGTTSHSGEYWLLNEKTGKIERQLTRTNSWQDEIPLSEPEEMWIDCLDGGGKVHGWVLPPQDKKEGEKYPAILYIHGGPHPFYAYGFDYEHQIFSGAGFAVIYCNPRGSSSYGREHESMTKAFDGTAYTDLLQFVDEACRKFDFIDSDRLGVTGGSYGGYMTNKMAVGCKKFKAYITQRSIASEQISYASSDMQGDSSNFRSFEDFMIYNIEKSVVSYAENLNAPILIMHGMKDLRCPVENAHQLYTAFKDIHPEIPVKMILYPNTTHSQPTDYKSKYHYYTSMVNWFKKYL